MFAQSPKGRGMLLHAGHKYVLVRDYKNGTKTWRCNAVTKYGCKAAAKTMRNKFMLVKDHNHARENFKIKVVKMKKGAK